ncbi:MAG: response regulator [Bdellovibrionaceae bacterium]|nr:response regulator [Pseudobdellovibrionaceae bacterium]
MNASLGASLIEGKWSPFFILFCRLALFVVQSFSGFTDIDPTAWQTFFAQHFVLIITWGVSRWLGLAEDFAEKNYQVTQAENLGALTELFFDYAILDLRLLGDSGLCEIPKLKKHNPQCAIVVLTGYGSVATAVEAIKLGALNYLNKPTSSELIEAALKDNLKEEFKEKSQDRPNHKYQPMHHLTPLALHEVEYIEFVLTQNHGNVTRSAKQLGLHRQGLQRKLKKLH